jgi:hypothetical protein
MQNSIQFVKFQCCQSISDLLAKIMATQRQGKFASPGEKCGENWIKNKTYFLRTNTNLKCVL